jgi:peptidoglycan lytic transglycosylase
MKLAARLAVAAGMLLVVSLGISARIRPAPATAAAAPAAAKSAFTQKQLEELSRVLKEKNSSWAYGKLSEYATQKSAGALGTRAALALGFYDYNHGDFAKAAKWLDRAKADPLLGAYGLYWKGVTDVAQGHNDDALEEFKRLRKEFPDFVMTEDALESLADAALASNRPIEGVEALDHYAQTAELPKLLLLRARAHEQAGQTVEAAADYQAVYLRFALSDHAGEAGRKFALLRSASASNIAPLTPEQKFAHATILFNAKQWTDARAEYAELLPELSGADHERAELRILECGLALGAPSAEIIAHPISDPDVDAERFHALADYYRGRQQDADMVAAADAVVSRAPSSGWAEATLFLAGNYFWTQLDRDRAAGYYSRVVKQFATAPDADAADWRVAWVAVMKRQPEAAKLIEDHIRRFHDSAHTVDALYFLGRLAEEGGNVPLARNYYAKLGERYAQNYFGSLGSARLRALGPEPKGSADVLAAVPPLPQAPAVDDPPSSAAAGPKARADALRSIAFDSSAMLELKAGYAATGEARLLLEAAQASNAAGHYGGAIVTIRQIYPQLESRKYSDVPRAVWLASYALPYESLIRRWSARTGLDPMLVAGLIHQESAFDPEARSVANAIGLMQLLPETARRMAKQARVRYSRAQLVNPDYNIRLGTTYLAALRKQFGTTEAALAAYNAGEDRVVAWTSGQTYRDTPEFVESIPFTQTREYVQIIMRNTDIYRHFYGAPDESRKSRESGGQARTRSHH